MAPFQTVIGGALIIISLLRLFGGYNFLYNIASLLGGFLLLTHVLSKALAFKDGLMKLSDKLSPFKAIIGIALLAVGILGLF